MHAQDLSQNRRLASLARITQELQQSRSAGQSMRILQHGFAELEGFVGSILVSTRGLAPGEYRVIQTRLDEFVEDDFLIEPSRRSSAHAEPLPIASGGIIGSIVRVAEPQLIQDVDWSGDPLFGERLSAYHSAIAMPISGDHLPMNWAILLKKSPERFTVSDLEHAVERVALIGALLENQLLAAELARAHEQIDSDARQVGELQRALLPTSLPRLSTVEVATSYEPCGRAGGDLYDFFPLDPTQSRDDTDSIGNTPSSWCVVIGDASGHNLAAAVVMAIVQTVLLARPAGLDGPAALLTHANRQLCRKQIGGFFTAFLGIYDPDSRQFTYANAGHPAPMLKRSMASSIESSSIQLLDSALACPLGIDESADYTETTIQLQRTDTLLLYTDGITEARDNHGEMFETKRVERILRESHNPRDLIDRLCAAVRTHQHKQPASDDQTIVAAQIL